MGITKADLDAQYAMLKRGEEKRKADWKLAERERLRDTFAAAALTGMMSRVSGKAEEFAEAAYKLADAMLRERNGAVDTRETVCPHVRGTVTQHCTLNFTLTDSEREAIYRAEARLRTAYVPDDETAATLRSLLARLAVK
jgi:hypothetical protein